MKDEQNNKTGKTMKQQTFEKRKKAYITQQKQQLFIYNSIKQLCNFKLQKIMKIKKNN